MTRATYLIQSNFDRLEDWCRMVRVIFGPQFGPYLVGSVRERPDYRDVDIRVLVRDDDFDRLFRGRLEAVRFLNRAFSVWGQQETGLPIDFQVQRQSEANAEFDKPRNAMGVRDWSLIPTSGVPARPAPEAPPAGESDALVKGDRYQRVHESAERDVAAWPEWKRNPPTVPVSGIRRRQGGSIVTAEKVLAALVRAMDKAAADFSSYDWDWFQDERVAPAILAALHDAGWTLVRQEGLDAAYRALARVLRGDDQ